MDFQIDSLFNLFLIVSAVHGIVFCFVALVSKAGKEKSMRYLSLLVLMISLSNLQTWGVKPFLESTYILNYFFFPWHLLIGVFFYAFLVNYLQIEKQTYSLLRLILPFFGFVIAVRVLFVYWFQFSENEIFDEIRIYNSLEEVVSLLFSLGGFVYAFMVFVNNKKLYADIVSYDDLKWVVRFFKLGGFTYLVWLLALFVTIVVNDFEFKYSYYPLKVFSAILIYWLGYQGVLQFKLVKQRRELRSLIHNNRHQQNLILSEVLIKEEANNEEEFRKVMKLINKDKLYLNSNLTLELFAAEIEMSSSKLSRLINKKANKNFSDFINEFRVNYSKEILSNKDYKNYTIVAIGLESGFNSKSTFYKVFKKIVGCTPVNYRKK
jgi:AraC-like DNA-binding protein